MFSVNAVMRWILVIVIYVLLYLGADTGLWPMIGHFHHHDMKMPGFLDAVLSSVVLPLLLAIFLASIAREDFLGKSGWPLLFAPLVLSLISKYLADAFYPPFWSEFLSILGASAIQGVSAIAGWFIYRRFHSARSAGTAGAQHSTVLG